MSKSLRQAKGNRKQSSRQLNDSQLVTTGPVGPLHEIVEEPERSLREINKSSKEHNTDKERHIESVNFGQKRFRMTPNQSSPQIHRKFSEMQQLKRQKMQELSPRLKSNQFTHQQIDSNPTEPSRLRSQNFDVIDEQQLHRNPTPEIKCINNPSHGFFAHEQVRESQGSHFNRQEVSFAGSDISPNANFKKKNTPIDQSKDLCVHENPESPSVQELECNESYERVGKIQCAEDPLNAALDDDSSNPCMRLHVFPFGKNGQHRRALLAPHGSPVNSISIRHEYVQQVGPKIEPEPELTSNLNNQEKIQGNLTQIMTQSQLAPNTDDFVCYEEEQILVLRQQTTAEELDRPEIREIDGICSEISIQSCMNKSVNYQVNRNLFSTIQRKLIYPEHRTQLLDWIQFECQRFSFRRQTYYLAQMYIDLFLSRQSTLISDFKLTGITALHMAMKIEEVDLVALGRMVSKTDIKKVSAIERKIITTLNHRLLPDTMVFWLESVIKFWDQFAANKQPTPLPIFFKTSIRYVGADSHMILNPVVLEKDNMYRRAMQALDLMSLHFGIHNFRRTSLALSVMVIELMQELEILDLTPDQDVSCLQKHLAELVSSPEEQSFDKQFFYLFSQFIETYCYEMVPAGFIVIDWPLYLKDELVFASQFFLFETEFKEPFRKLKPTEIPILPNGTSIRVEYSPQQWMSHEHYLAAHQHTTNGAQFVRRLIQSSQSRTESDQ